MSFSSRVKEELIRLPLGKDHCVLAELSALTQTSGTLGFQGGGRLSVTYQLSSPALARRVLTMLKDCLWLTPQLHFVESTRLGGRRSSVLTVEGADAGALLQALRVAELDEDGRVSIRHTTPRPQLTRDCCRRAFLRGAFLGAGSVSEPDKGYHFEWTGDEALGQTIQRTLEKSGLRAASYERRDRRVVYIKNAQDIADALALMGASRAVMELENLRITRQMRGDANRASNCDEHNSEKLINAAERQMADIKLVSIQRGLFQLPPALREIARLRLERPELSLEELGRALEPPISKSGVYHRLARLSAIAREIERELEESPDEHQPAR